MALNSLAPYRQKILDAAARRGARNVRVFGSVARGDDRSDNDIDLLVDVEAGRTLLDVIGLEQNLHEILGQRATSWPAVQGIRCGSCQTASCPSDATSTMTAAKAPVSAPISVPAATECDRHAAIIPALTKMPMAAYVETSDRA
jgi:predicted nucleotidyltransferase